LRDLLLGQFSEEAVPLNLHHVFLHLFDLDGFEDGAHQFQGLVFFEVAQILLLVFDETDPFLYFDGQRFLLGFVDLSLAD
jgi:hypothetical protein